MNYAELNQARRSVDHFDPTVEISPAELAAIYDAAKLAPTSFNIQPYRIVVARSRESRARLVPISLNQQKIADASAVLIILGCRQAHLEWEDVLADWQTTAGVSAATADVFRRIARELYGGQVDVFVSRNVGLFAMNFMLAAKDAGWDTLPLDGFDADRVRALCGANADYLAVMMIAIGKPAPGGEPFPRLMRRDFSDVFTFI